MELLAAASWTLDVAFFVIILVGIFLGVLRGFAKYFTKIAGTILSIALAISFCVPFKNTLNTWFGMQTALAGALGSDLAAGGISIAISFVGLVIIVRLLAWLLGTVCTALIGKSKAMNSINRILGAVIGLVLALSLIFIALVVMYWINLPAVDSFIGESKVVGAIYRWEYFRYAAQFSYL